MVDEQGNPVRGLSLSPTSVNVTDTWQQFYVWVLADNSIPLTGAGKGYPVRVRASSGNIVREQPLIVDVWTPVGSANLNFARVAASDSGIFVVAGRNGYDEHNRIYVYNSQNGNFTMVYEDRWYANTCGWLADIAYDPVHQTWVVVGDEIIMVSADKDNAQTWQIVRGSRYPGGCSKYDDYRWNLGKVRYVNGLWAWSYYTNTNLLHFSQDGGYTWNNVLLPVPQGYDSLVIRNITFGKGKYVAVGELFKYGDADLMIATSTDGVNWNVTSLNTFQTPWGKALPSDIIYVPDWEKFVMVGGFGLIGISSDGMNWDLQINYDRGHLGSVVYGNGALVATSATLGLITFTDGQNWRRILQMCDDAWFLAFGGGIFAHTAAGPLCTSP